MRLPLRGYFCVFIFLLSFIEAYFQDTEQKNTRSLLNSSSYFETSEFEVENICFLIQKGLSLASDFCNIYSANSLNRFKCSCPLLKKKRNSCFRPTYSINLHIHAYIHTYFTLNLSLHDLYLYPFAESKDSWPFLNSTKYSLERILKKSYTW